VKVFTFLLVTILIFYAIATSQYRSDPTYTDGAVIINLDDTSMFFVERGGEHFKLPQKAVWEALKAFAEQSANEKYANEVPKASH